MSTYQAYQVNVVDQSHSHLSPTLLENLSIQQLPTPTPGPGEVLVRIRAAALNFRDILCIADSPLYPTRTPDGLIPCSDGAGEIVSVGSGSTWKDSIGAAVILVPCRDWIDGEVAWDMDNVLGSGTADGSLAQYAVVKDPWIVRAPKNFSFEEAAALPGASATAVNVLESVPVGRGTTVVTQGTGGVSCAVIQQAAALGARVIATSSSNEKLEIARQLGASDLINYRTTPDWVAEVLRLTGGGGADLVCDVVGELEPSTKALKLGGTVALVGFLKPPGPTDLLMPLITGAKSLKGILGYSRVMLEKAVRLSEDHDIHPYLGKVYDWEDAPEAFEDLRAQDTVGKIVIKVPA